MGENHILINKTKIKQKMICLCSSFDFQKEYDIKKFIMSYRKLKEKYKRETTKYMWKCLYAEMKKSNKHFNQKFNKILEEE